MPAKIAPLLKISVEPVPASGSGLSAGNRLACALALAAPLLLSACGSSNILAKAEVDNSLITGSVSPVSQASAPPRATQFTGASPQVASDEATIRNAVSSADLKVLDGKGISWANPSTGSSGEISAVTEYRQDESLCRRFTTSRQSFDGVALYHGNACLDSTGAWQMMNFQAS
jgi:surface antigen